MSYQEGPAVRDGGKAPDDRHTGRTPRTGAAALLTLSLLSPPGWAREPVEPTKQGDLLEDRRLTISPAELTSLALEHLSLTVVVEEPDPNEVEKGYKARLKVTLSEAHEIEPEELPLKEFAAVMAARASVARLQEFIDSEIDNLGKRFNRHIRRFEERAQLNSEAILVRDLADAFSHYCDQLEEQPGLARDLHTVEIKGANASHLARRFEEWDKYWDDYAETAANLDDIDEDLSAQLKQLASSLLQPETGNAQIGAREDPDFESACFGAEEAGSDAQSLLSEAQSDMAGLSLRFDDHLPARLLPKLAVLDEVQKRVVESYLLFEELYDRLAQAGFYSLHEEDEAVKRAAELREESFPVRGFALLADNLEASTKSIGISDLGTEDGFIRYVSEFIKRSRFVRSEESLTGLSQEEGLALEHLIEGYLSQDYTIFRLRSSGWLLDAAKRSDFRTSLEGLPQKKLKARVVAILEKAHEEGRYVDEAELPLESLDTVSFGNTLRDYFDRNSEAQSRYPTISPEGAAFISAHGWDLYFFVIIPLYALHQEKFVPLPRIADTPHIASNPHKKIPGNGPSGGIR